MRHHTIFAASLLIIGACSASSRHQASTGERINKDTTPSPTLAIECVATKNDFQRSNCVLKVKVAHDGRILTSSALPISANSLQILPILPTWLNWPDKHSGLSDTSSRKINAWSVGHEEHAVDVAVEIATIGNTPMLIVHQRYGFEHVSQSHQVFEITHNALDLRLEAKRDARPEHVELWPEQNSVVIRRTPIDSSQARETRYVAKKVGDQTLLVLAADADQ